MRRAGEPVVLGPNRVCACLDKYGERKVMAYDRCLNCGTFMEAVRDDEPVRRDRAAIREAFVEIVAEELSDSRDDATVEDVVGWLDAAMGATPWEVPRGR